MKPHEKGKQFCNYCNKITLHTPKLGLAIQQSRLCSVCNRANKIMKH